MRTDPASVPASVDAYPVDDFTIGLDGPRQLDPFDEKPEVLHPAKVWVLLEADQVPNHGLDYATPEEMRGRFAPPKVANDTLPSARPMAPTPLGKLRPGFATPDESVAFVEHAQAPAVARFMKVAEYATYRGLCKRTIETRILEGMPLDGRGKYRRVHVERADEWFRNRGTGGIDDEAKLHAGRLARALVRPAGGKP